MPVKSIRISIIYIVNTIDILHIVTTIGIIFPAIDSVFIVMCTMDSSSYHPSSDIEVSLSPVQHVRTRSQYARRGLAPSSELRSPVSPENDRAESVDEDEASASEIMDTEGPYTPTQQQSSSSRHMESPNTRIERALLQIMGRIEKIEEKINIRQRSSSRESDTHDQMNPRPSYKVHQLSKSPSSREVERWISAINEGNEAYHQYAESTLVDWAIRHTCKELQASWADRLRSQLAQDPEYDVRLRDVWTFVRACAAKRTISALNHRDQMESISQQVDESPMEFFRRWRALHKKIDPDRAFDQDMELGHHFYYRLHPDVQSALRPQLTNGDISCEVVEIMTAAEKLFHHSAEQPNRGMNRWAHSSPDLTDGTSQASSSRDVNNGRSMRCSKCDRKGHTSFQCMQMGNRRR
ncbi:hypothetical protein GGR50DRAFT_699030 [Xylaria sp. CBS 124048]|nr:hypothetical protein GGR50DRAFT_699030 [Xylaria sp. CBS 124048]